jgi:type IV secretory pathway TraG/TraD family ATPase VirD4
MRPTLRDFALPIILLISGVTVAALGVTGVIWDIAAAIPARWLSSADGRPPEAAWWLRACLAHSRCRESAAALFASSVAGHGRALWCGMLVIVVSAAWLRNLRLRARPRQSVGDARFASRGELRRLVHRSPGAWFPLGYAQRWPLPYGSRPVAGLVSTLATAWAQPVRLPEEDLARHVLVVGLTGAHKTTSVAFPVLLEAARAGVSVVALDLKYGETDSLARAAPEWQRWARDVLVFAPLEPATLRWNPLDRCRTIGDAYQIAAQLFDDPDPSDADLMYWVGAERHVSAVLCLALATDAGPTTFGRLRSLCESGPAAVHAYLRAHPDAPALMLRLGAYLALLPKDQAGILQGIASRLEAWGDEMVCAATGPAAGWEHVDLSRVRREPVLLLVGVPQAALGRLRWLCHLFLRNLAAHLLSPRGPDEQVRVLLILEELPAWGALPGLADHLATYRSRQVSVLATLQSEAQGEHVYGCSGWAAVAANLVTKLYFPSLSDVDAERLSRVMGTTAGEDVARSRGWGSTGTRKGEHRRTVPVPLERSEELRGTRSSPEEILVRFARMPPARLWCPPYYLRPEYSGRVPDRQIKTAELAVYHHLWTIRTQMGNHVQHHVELPSVENPPPAPTEVPPHPTADALVARTAEEPVPITGLPVDLAPPDDVANLNRLFQALLEYSRQGAGNAIKAVHRGGRIVELRVNTEAITQVCNGTEAMQALARRWSVPRWVRRVRPSFVLSRRAVEALDQRLLEHLHIL